MTTAKDINELFGVTESFMIPDRLMTLLFSDEIDDIFEKYTQIEEDLSKDCLTNYFQEEHSNRAAMMQDYTPSELTELVARVSGDTVKSCLDICAGTGGLTIAMHAQNPDCVFYCEELSKRSIPFLLFNLAVRNIEAYVSNKDVLSREVMACWHVIPCDKFARIEAIDAAPEVVFDAAITNPPYSLSYEFDKKSDDPRFDGYGYTPRQYSDYAFILDGLSRVKDDGTVTAILPHGVLFRAKQEKTIRENMVEKGNIKTIIGLPDKLFLNTQIPVVVMCYSKSKSSETLFIDASRNYEKTKQQNRLREQDIAAIIDAINNPRFIEKFAFVATRDFIAENDYNLNIPRYVDTYEAPPPIDVYACVTRLEELERDKFELMKSIRDMTRQLKVSSSNSEKCAELKAINEFMDRSVERYEEYQKNQTD